MLAPVKLPPFLRAAFGLCSLCMLGAWVGLAFVMIDDIGCSHAHESCVTGTLELGDVRNYKTPEFSHFNGFVTLYMSCNTYFLHN